MTMRSLLKEDRDILFSEYMHSIWQWKTIDWQITMVGWYMDGDKIIDWFRNFIKNYKQK